MNDTIKKFRKRRDSRLGKRCDADTEESSNAGGGKKGGHGNTRLPYGIAKSEGIDTTGMTPNEVWEALGGKGYSAKSEYKALKEAKGKGNRGATETKTEKATVKAQNAIHDSESFSAALKDFRKQLSDGAYGPVNGENRSEFKRRVTAESSVRSAMEVYANLEQEDNASPADFEKARKHINEVVSKLPIGTKITLESGGRDYSGIDVFEVGESGLKCTARYSGSVKPGGKFFEHDIMSKNSVDQLIDSMRDVLDGRMRIKLGK